MRHNGGGIPLNRNHVFDSNGPDMRVRGTAQQLFEKYLQLGRDATSGGDRVMAESFALWPLRRVLAAVRETDSFKFNVNLVLIDLFLRRGVIAGQAGAALRAALSRA